MYKRESRDPHCLSCCQVGHKMCDSCSLWVESLNFSWSNAEANGRKTFPFFYAFSPAAVKNILMFSPGYLHMLHAITFIKY